MRERILGLDHLKAVLISLVVLGHSIQWTTSDFLHHWLFIRIYAFHMPAFFLLCGFFTFKHVRCLKSDLLRIVGLLVPYYVWGVIGAFIPTGGTLWFLQTLAVFSILSYVVHYISLKYGIKEDALCCLATALLVLCGGRDCLLWGIRVGQLPFFCAGYFIKKYWAQVGQYIINRKVVSLTLGIGILCLVVYGSMPTKAFALIVRCIIAIAMSVGLFGAFWHFKCATLEYVGIGRLTLGIYAAHYAVINGILWLGITKYWLVCPVVFVVTALLVKVVEKVPVLNLLLLGKTDGLKKVRHQDKISH